MRRWLVLFFSLIAFPAFAENGLPLIAPGQALVGKFVQARHLNGFDAPMISEGRFVIVPEQGLVWRTEKPFETALTISREGIVQTVAGREVFRLPATQFPAMDTLREVLEASLSGNWALLENRFGTKPVYIGERWTLKISPGQSNSKFPMKNIEMEGGAFVERVEIKRNGGDFDLITFSEQQAKVLDQLSTDQMPKSMGDK